MIIIGGGIVGAACALEAAALGAETVLVDAARPGRATAAGAGIISPWSSRVDDPAWHSFATAAAREYPALIDRLAEAGETDTGYRNVGALYLAESEEARDRLRARLDAARTDAPEMGEVRSLSGDQARELFPPLKPDALAVYIGGAARVDGRLISAALTRAAAEHGARIRTGSARLLLCDGAPASANPASANLTSANPTNGRVRGVEVDGEVIEADAVIAATGAWTAEFLRPAGVTPPVEPQRGQIAHFSLGGADTSRWPVILPGGSGHYMLAFDDSRVVAGATRETGSGFDYRMTAAGLAEVLSQALAVAPGLADATYLETRIGFRPMGPDYRPLLGPVTGVDGLVVATGLGASGLTMGPRAGAIAARVALGLPPGTDLSPFDPLRPAPDRTV
jgi:D-amino-acid dehydrogenase